MTLQDFIKDYKWWYKNKHLSTDILEVFLIVGSMHVHLIEMELIEYLLESKK